MVRFRWVIAMLATGALVAGACTSDTSDDATQGQTTSPGEAQEPVTLQFWAHSGWTPEYYEAMIDAFEEEYPYITVNFTRTRRATTRRRSTPPSRPAARRTSGGSARASDGGRRD